MDRDIAARGWEGRNDLVWEESACVGCRSEGQSEVEMNLVL